MDICNTVANTTHNKYGICIYVTHRIYGQIAIIAHMSVPSTNNISILARGKLRKPNCIGVKSILKIILSKKGKNIKKGILSAGSAAKKVLINTAPNENIIPTYSTVHTGLNSHDGGDHVGFNSSA